MFFAVFFLPPPPFVITPGLRVPYVAAEPSFLLPSTLRTCVYSRVCVYALLLCIIRVCARVQTTAYKRTHAEPRSRILLFSSRLHSSARAARPRSLRPRVGFSSNISRVSSLRRAARLRFVVIIIIITSACVSCRLIDFFRRSTVVGPVLSRTPSAAAEIRVRLLCYYCTRPHNYPRNTSCPANRGWLVTP